MGLRRHKVVWQETATAVGSAQLVDQADAKSLPAFPSICSPILLRDQVVHGGLDGKLYVVPMSGDAEPWTFATAFGSPITASAAICDGRIYFGCEDGYLYVLGPDGKAPLPTRDLELWQVRSPLTGEYADAKYDWYTNYGDMGCTNANDQGIEPPVKIKWIRRVEGTVKHLPVCGGGRMYTHTAEGQIMAVEQETGRLLWRRYWPGVYLSFTSPLYYREKLLVPQAGIARSRMRCLDAATGEVVVGASLYRFAELESPVSAGRPRQPGDLCLGVGALCGTRFGAGVYLSRDAAHSRLMLPK